MESWGGLILSRATLMARLAVCGAFVCFVWEIFRDVNLLQRKLF
jgi:hypothetical protein